MSETNQMTIGPVRFSFLNVFEPKTAPGSTKAKYGSQILIPKSNKALVEKIKKTIVSLKGDAATFYKGKLPAGFKMPLKDGDATDEDGAYIYGEEQRGCYFFTASSDNKPGVLGKDKQPVFNQEDVYSGMWGFAHVNFYEYGRKEGSPGKGITAGLNNIMKTKDDKRFDGRVSAEKAFESIDPDLIDVDDEDALGL